MEFPYLTAEEQAAAMKYVKDNNIPESQLWIDGAVLRIKDAEEQV